MILRSIVNGQLGARRQNARPAQPWPRFPLSFLLPDYSCVRHDEFMSYGNMGDTVPPFGLAFSSAAHLQDVLAVANEEGIVRVYNTEGRERSLLKEWLAHENAVFDVAWVPGEPQLVTAAGDQMARLWDVRSGELLDTFRGHLCSLKSVAFSPQDKALFCTGARDGNIMVWDMRCTKKDGFHKQVKQICGAHNKAEENSMFKSKRRRSSIRGMAPSVDSQQSVTVVLFRDQHTLLSSGAVDGVVKMWDLRKNYSAHRQEPTPLQTFPYPGSSLRTRLGYSGLVLDSTRSNVLCNCTDDNIYMFNVSGVKTSPVAVFNGHQNSSFYIRSSLSPDDQFLASGSSDSHTYIWKISCPTDPPVMLQGHSEEVTSVSWCPTDFTKIASCSDDHTVRLWRLHRGTEEVQSSLGEANLVGWSRPKSPPRHLTQTETTPAKTQRAQSLGGLSSPRAAACASNSATLPLPSSTKPLSPVTHQKTPVARQNTPVTRQNTPVTRQNSPGTHQNTPGTHQNTPVTRQNTPVTRRNTPGTRRNTPTSIKQWLSPAHGAASQSGATVLGEQNEASPPTEQRAKRRLEESSRSCCADEDECQCVMELNPPKRSRTSGLCCLEPEKENCCPTSRNWLSALGQRMRKSPRRAEGRLSASPNTCSPQRMKKISTYFTKRTGE